MRGSVEEYLELPYHIVLVSDHDDEGTTGWVAEVSELPGCMSQGATPDEAIVRIHDAMRGWISVAVEDGQAIPPPVEPSQFSGRFVVRLPKTLHAEASRVAEDEGVSLNQFVSAALAGAVAWRTRGRERERVGA